MDTAHRANPRRSIPLQLVGSPDPGAKIVRSKGSGPLFQGAAEADYVCGSCRAVLCAGIGVGRLAGLVFGCACGALNVVPDAPLGSA